ncbi:MAG: helix-turn-helix transcriptional regulator [Acidimicrobiales bacterium]
MDSENTLRALAALDEPLRFKMYRLAVAAPPGVTRDIASESTGVARSVAAFHLDKLAALGLLEVYYRRPSGVGGPGAGRPAKWYRRSKRQFDLSVPPRRYELAASMLAEAVEAASQGSNDLDTSLRRAARRNGVEIGDQARDAEASPDELLVRLAGVLECYGYEPSMDGTGGVLLNCPFHALVEEHRQLTCSMNHWLLAAAARAAGLAESTACLDPAPDRCCVRLVAKPRVAARTQLRTRNKQSGRRPAGEL